MNLIRPKQPRLRLNCDAYHRLRQTVLERDKWRCQYCGAMKNLQVHHQIFRSHSGDDSQENLITLCHDCHERQHASVHER